MSRGPHPISHHSAPRGARQWLGRLGHRNWSGHRSRLLAVGLLAALLGSACTAEAPPEPDTGSEEPTPSEDPTPVAITEATLTPADVEVPDRFQPAADAEHLDITRLAPAGDGWQVLGTVEDGERRRPVLFELDDVPSTVRARHDLPLPDGVVHVTEVRYSEDGSAVLALGAHTDGTVLGLVWPADDPAAEPVRLDHATSLTDAQLDAGIAVGASRSDTGEPHPTAWTFAGDAPARVLLGDGSSTALATSVVDTGEQLRVWVVDAEQGRTTLLTGPAADGPEGLATTPLPAAMEGARSVNGEVDTEAGRFAYGSIPNANHLYVPGLWQQAADGNWAPVEGEITSSRTYELYDVQATSSGLLFWAGVGELGDGAVWVVRDGEVISADTAPADRLAVRVDGAVEDLRTLSLIDDELRADGEPVTVEGLPPTSGGESVWVEAVAEDLVVLRSGEDTIVLADGEEVSRERVIFSDIAAFGAGPMALVGSVDDDFESTRPYLHLLEEGALRSVELPEVDDGTVRLVALVQDRDDLLALGHWYDDGPQALAIRVRSNGKVTRAIEVERKITGGVARPCTDTAALTFDGQLSVGILVRARSGIEHIDLPANYGDDGAPTRCVALDDERTLVVLRKHLFIVGPEGVEEHVRRPDLLFSGVGEGVLTTVAGSDAAIFPVDDPHGEGEAIAVVPLDDLEATSFVSLPRDPRRTTSLVATPSAPTALLVSATQGRRTTVAQLRVE